MKKFLFLTLFLLSFSVNAVPVFIELKFFVDSVEVPNPAPCTDPPKCTVFSPGIDDGDVFRGSFSVDDALLPIDGDDVVLPVENIFIAIGGVIWDQTDPNSVFVGAASVPGPVEPGVAESGFDIRGGRIINVFGSVGGDDFPAVDFNTSASGPGRFLAIDLSQNAVSGIFVVPEPSTLAITGTGLLIGLVCMWRRRRVIFTWGGITISRN